MWQSDMEFVSEAVLKRRAACEKWKRANREYYLKQKRDLANRSEYKAHRREQYKQKTDELKELGILPRKKGRPQLYLGQECIERRLQQGRKAAARYRLKKKSRALEKDESTIDETSDEE